MRFGFQFLTAALAAALTPAAASAETFRCTAADGSILYSDTACPRDSIAAQNVTERIGQCTSVECAAARRQSEQDAWMRLQAQKEEAARYQELRLRAEESRLRAQQAERNLEVVAALEARIEQLLQEQSAPVYFHPRFVPRKRHHAGHNCGFSSAFPCFAHGKQFSKPPRRVMEPVRTPHAHAGARTARAGGGRFLLDR